MKALWITLLLLSPLSHGRIVERILAVVNDQMILQSDLERFKRSLKSGGFIDESLIRLTDRKQLVADPKALLNHLIDERVLDYEVKKRNMEVTIERVEQEIRSITGRQGINRSQLREVLAERGITFADYQEFIKRSIERQALIEREVSSKIKISDEDVAAYYLKKKGPTKSQAFEFHLAHILFLPSNGGDAAAKDRADKVLSKLREGQVFEKLAEQYSEDPGFSQGGNLGTFKSGEMNIQIEKAVSGLNTGEISNLVETKTGVHIIKVLKKTVTSDPELEAKTEEYRNILFADAFKRQFRNWLNQRRDEAAIRIN